MIRKISSCSPLPSAQPAPRPAVKTPSAGPDRASRPPETGWPNKERRGAQALALDHLLLHAGNNHAQPPSELFGADRHLGLARYRRGCGGAMANNKVSAIVVVDDKGATGRSGATERDVLNRVVARAGSGQRRPVGGHLTSQLQVAAPDKPCPMRCTLDVRRWLPSCAGGGKTVDRWHGVTRNAPLAWKSASSRRNSSNAVTSQRSCKPGNTHPSGDTKAREAFCVLKLRGGR